MMKFSIFGVNIHFFQIMIFIAAAIYGGLGGAIGEGLDLYVLQ
jgi:hypothetical protein